jgi:hypothetical protein
LIFDTVAVNVTSVGGLPGAILLLKVKVTVGTSLFMVEVILLASVLTNVTLGNSRFKTMGSSFSVF